MNRNTILVGALAFSVIASSAFARDVKYKMPLEEAKMYGPVWDVLSGGVAMYWGDQPHPKIKKEHGVFKVSKRTNGFLKQAGDSCPHALASALIELQAQAERAGGNAVIGIKSNIKNNEESSVTEYSCLVGSMMVNVALKGTVVTIKK